MYSSEVREKAVSRNQSCDATDVENGNLELKSTTYEIKGSLAWFNRKFDMTEEKINLKTVQ